MKQKYSLKSTILFTIVASVMIAGSSGCVQFKPAALYEGVAYDPPAPPPTSIGKVVEPVIFSDDHQDVWGLNENLACQQARVTKLVTYSGDEALEITWNRGAEGCDWAGIGIGWDRYAGKDLSPIMDLAAVQFYVRTITGKMFALPMVLTLEDYSGGMGFSYTANQYFERSAIDEEWQKVVVPLSSFEIEKENLDPTNIKQLQIELQQSGNVYLDDIRLVNYEKQPLMVWMEEEKLPDPIALPIVVFDDAFTNNNGWGLITNECQQISTTSAQRSEGSTSLHVKWNNGSENCSPIAFGVSWNKWHPVDITPILPNAFIEFDLKTDANMEASKLSMQVGFEDYDRAKSFVTLQTTYAISGTYSSQWSRIRIPLSQLPANIDFKRIKHLLFNLDGSGEVYIDNIRLVK